MGRVLYIVAVILVIGWAITFLGGIVDSALIHIVLAVAFILIIVNIIGGATRKTKY